MGNGPNHWELCEWLVFFLIDYLPKICIAGKNWRLFQLTFLDFKCNSNEKKEVEQVVGDTWSYSKEFYTPY